MLAVLLGWVAREQGDVIDFLREDNRVLQGQPYGRRIRMTDRQRRLAVRGRRLLSDYYPAAGNRAFSSRTSRGRSFAAVAGASTVR